MDDQYPSFDELAKFIDDWIITLNATTKVFQVLCWTLHWSRPDFQATKRIGMSGRGSKDEAVLQLFGASSIQRLSIQGPVFWMQATASHINTLAAHGTVSRLKNEVQWIKSAKGQTINGDHICSSCPQLMLLPPPSEKFSWPTACVILGGPNHQKQVRARFWGALGMNN